jgi:hypothetical protein
MPGIYIHPCITAALCLQQLRLAFVRDSGLHMCLCNLLVALASTACPATAAHGQASQQQAVEPLITW